MPNYIHIKTGSRSGFPVFIRKYRKKKAILKKIHYAWAVAFFTCLMTVGLGAQVTVPSVFLIPVAKSLGINVTTVSFAYSVGQFTAMFVTPLCAGLFQKYPVRKLLCFFLLIQACGLLLYSSAVNIFMMVGAGLLESTGIACFIYVLPTVIVKKWFCDKGELVLGMFITASMLGGVIFTPIASAITYSAGWRAAYQCLAVYVLTVGIAGALLAVKERPEDLGLKPYEDPIKKSVIQEKRHVTGGAELTVRSAWHAKEFYLAVFYLVAIQYCVGMQNHLGNYGMSLGLSAALGAVFASVCHFGGLVSRVSLSFLNERIGVRTSTFLCAGIGIAASLTLCFVKSLSDAMIYVLGFLFGIALKCGLIETTAMCYEVFGASDDYGRIYANIVLVGGVTATTASTVFGFIYDTTGSYQSVMILLAVLYALAIVLANALLGGRRVRN